MPLDLTSTLTREPSTTPDGAPGAAGRSEAPASHPVSMAPTGAHGTLSQLALMATGVVFGDIGTSPLYALKECIDPEHGVPPTEANLLGVLSLVFWSLTMVVTVKYLTFIMRADNRGEGGILALLALAPRRRTQTQPR